MRARPSFVRQVGPLLLLLPGVGILSMVITVVDGAMEDFSQGLKILLAVGIIGGFLAIQFIAMRRRRRLEHRMAHGLCAECGYDLGASAVRCPECP